MGDMRWKRFLQRDMSPLFEYLIQTGIRDHTSQAIGADFNFRYRKIDDAVIYHDEHELEQVNEIVSAMAQEGPGYLKGICSGCASRSRLLVEMGRRIEKEYLAHDDKPSKEQVRRWLLRYFRSHRKIMPYLPVFPAVIDRLAQEMFDAEMERAGVEDEERQAIQNSLITWDYGTAERVSLSCLARQAGECGDLFQEEPDVILRELEELAPKLYDGIRKHTRRYSWMNIHHLKGRPWSEGEIVRRVKNALQGGTGMADYTREKIERRFHQTMEEHCIKGSERETIELIRNIVHWRNARKGYMDLSAYHMLNVFGLAADYLGIEQTQLVYLTADEILGCLNGELSVEETVSAIPERMESYAMIMFDGVIGTFANKEQELPYKELQAERVAGEVRGTTQLSKVGEGYARIVRSKEDVDKIRPGEVVVASSVSNDFAIGGASAIVADEGGFSIHPIIISRLFKIPTVTGTLRAMEEFKTGDYLRVDGRTGIVKKIDPPEDDQNP